ncbi:MAG: CBS domain-containing protein [Chitinophagaceae bacterium]|nr:CBS domain-containing protein [Chitinophagaceae bacterium]MBK7558949.1 CBS domain-containing protein [Chitinophagaceae bacterium]MBK8496967.1 CBS domain-containing protein [Chitinophagaceae bacterium]MBK9530958.1 CBS domain-containing protein [Chitinophagaceae bacterium]HQW44808.1 CBS domain-containing protein [Chitinophagaceae bacterium]
MGAVHHIIRSKGSAVFSIRPDITVFKALEIMLEKNVSSLVVMEDEKLIGIFTERDYARKVTLKGKTSKETPVGDIMSGNVITVSPDSTIDECMNLMTNNFIRHLPVMENDKLIGLISIGDVVKYIIQEQKFIIENMEQYIGGT